MVYFSSKLRYRRYFRYEKNTCMLKNRLASRSMWVYHRAFYFIRLHFEQLWITRCFFWRTNDLSKLKQKSAEGFPPKCSTMRWQLASFQQTFLLNLAPFQLVQRTMVISCDFNMAKHNDQCLGTSIAGESVTGQERKWHLDIAGIPDADMVHHGPWYAFFFKRPGWVHQIRCPRSTLWRPNHHPAVCSQDHRRTSEQIWWFDVDCAGWCIFILRIWNYLEFEVREECFRFLYLHVNFDQAALVFEQALGARRLKVKDKLKMWMPTKLPLWVVSFQYETHGKADDKFKRFESVRCLHFVPYFSDMPHSLKVACLLTLCCLFPSGTSISWKCAVDATGLVSCSFWMLFVSFCLFQKFSNNGKFVLITPPP